MKQYKYYGLSLRKGNVYDYLEEPVKDWLIEEAVKLDRCEIGLVIASIVKDAYAEESGAE